jgi:SulP family sulfate permease
MLAGSLLGVALEAALGAGQTGIESIGALRVGLPPLSMPDFSVSTIEQLIPIAIAVAMLSLTEAVSIARSVALKSGQRIDGNQEFIGQGLANISGAFFSGYASSGSFNRTGLNYSAGARTPLAAVFSALLLVALVALSAPLLAQIPMAALAALLLLVAVSLLDAPRWRQLLRLDRTEFGVALATTIATVTIRLEMAILLGTLLSLMSFLYRTSHPAMRTMGFDSTRADRQFVVIDEAARPEPAASAPGYALPECPQLKLLRMEGEVYFGATQHVADTLHDLRHAPQPQKHLLVMGKSMNFIDLAGAELWEAELNARRAMGGDLYFHRPRPEVIRMWATTGFTRLLGAEHQFPDKRTAIATIFTKLDPEICRSCKARVFWECQSAPGPADSR